MHHTTSTGRLCAVRQIISGGQTGADRAALEWAVENRIPHGGFCPKGRKAEDGQIPPHYSLIETPTQNYLERTQKNVAESDATVVFTKSSVLEGGSRRTQEFALLRQKPFLHLHRQEEDESAAIRLREFVVRHRIETVNIAGTRASKDPEIGRFVKAVLSLGFLRSQSASAI